MIRCVLDLRYTSLQACKLLLKKFPLPYQGGVDALKSLKVLQDKGEISNELILMSDEMYLQQAAQYQAESTLVLTRRLTVIKGSWHLWSLV